MLWLLPWFYPIAVRDEAHVHSYTNNSDTIPGDLHGVDTLSWDWRSPIAIPAHHVLRRRSESPEEAQDVLV